MPDASTLELQGLITFPADASPITSKPKEIAGSFFRVLNRFKLSSSGIAVRYTTAVSELLGWVARADVSKLNGDDRAVAQFVTYYVNVLSDAVDLAEATPLHEVRPKRLTETELMEYARSNQRLVQDYYYLSGPRATTEQKQHAIDFYEIISAFPSTEMLKDIVASQLRGAQAQAGLMRLLSEKGWAVYVPDNNNADEVTLWDVDGDVDLVAWKPKSKKLLLINSKGRTAKDGGTGRQKRHVAEIEHYPYEDSHPRVPMHKKIMEQVTQSLVLEGHTP